MTRFGPDHLPGEGGDINDRGMIVLIRSVGAY